jgi:hypothetical protein
MSAIEPLGRCEYNNVEVKCVWTNYCNWLDIVAIRIQSLDFSVEERCFTLTELC